VDGVPPGVRARGPVVEIADRLLIRLASLGPALPGPAAPGAGAPGTGTGVVVAGVADAPGVVAARPAAPLARRSA
jgi:hypothetical protein